MSQLGKEKILILRFSSMGDILHAMNMVSLLKERFPHASLHWAVRQDFSEIPKAFALIDQVWVLNRNLGFKGLLGLFKALRAEKFTHIYDAHDSIRSNILSLLLAPPYLRGWHIKFVQRTKERWKRFMLFKFRIDLYPLPQSMASTYLKPLKKWGLPQRLPVEPFRLNPPPNMGPQFLEIMMRAQNAVVLAPSASAPLKRWPIEYWMKLVQDWPNQQFFVLGGPGDEFCKKVQDVAPKTVINLAGQLTWWQSAWLVQNCKGVISNDTGILHIADFLAKPAVILVGPVPFGYPYRPSTKIMEQTLPCKPCSKHGFDPCKIPETLKCLRDILPKDVQSAFERQLER